MTLYWERRAGGPRARLELDLEPEIKAPPGPRSRPRGNSTLSL